MIKLLSLVLTSLVLVNHVSALLQSNIVSGSDGPPAPTKECPTNLSTTCNLRCTNGNYILDTKGCPTCACTSEGTIQRIVQPSTDTKDVPSKAGVQCSPIMCRMFCEHGFRRDKNGCEVCQCNDSPQSCPKLNCQNKCTSGYRKDYSNCPTCSCNDDDAQKKTDENNGCSPITTCKLSCKYGYERDFVGCQLCSCNRCPVQTCRMFCMYGFKKNSEGCDMCECNWEPVSEKIQCSERIPCNGNRVCNLDLHLCELVSGEKINYFVYDFEIDTVLFNDPQFVTTFKNGLINNIAAKYNLEPSQISVTAVEPNGMTSFQIMPYYLENADEFQTKMDKIDTDLNSQEFRRVLPAVTDVIDKKKTPSNDSLWNHYVNKKFLAFVYIVGILIGILATMLSGIYFFVTRQCNLFPRRSESKSPIFDTPYQPAPTEEEQYHAVRAPDGTAYVVVESEEPHPDNDKRIIV
ncbi:unnamed protein product [Adineta ricciae]|uniref:Antistasin-like domain-containing protein n=1 Tax=Adineta ricciae TaxID=249248 RepID=A0A813RMW1_ADIRI|nr:unnamed protein product [Adineta ricciae]CAF1104472.1 unnamed protein product [Adineta ricciae]